MTKPVPPTQPQFTCRKCKHTERAVQLRNVTVTVGWKASALACVSPCVMCTKCGDTTVVVDAKVGDLVDLVPAGGSFEPTAQPAASGDGPQTSVSQLDQAIEKLTAMRASAVQRDIDAAKAAASAPFPRKVRREAAKAAASAPPGAPAKLPRKARRASAAKARQRH